MSAPKDRWICPSTITEFARTVSCRARNAASRCAERTSCTATPAAKKLGTKTTAYISSNWVLMRTARWYHMPAGLSATIPPVPASGWAENICSVANVANVANVARDASSRARGYVCLSRLRPCGVAEESPRDQRRCVDRPVFAPRSGRASRPQLLREEGAGRNASDCRVNFVAQRADRSHIRRNSPSATAVTDRRLTVSAFRPSDRE